MACPFPHQQSHKRVIWWSVIDLLRCSNIAHWIFIDCSVYIQRFLWDFLWFSPVLLKKLLHFQRFPMVSFTIFTTFNPYRFFPHTHVALPHDHSPPPLPVENFVPQETLLTSLRPGGRRAPWLHGCRRVTCGGNFPHRIPRRVFLRENNGRDLQQTCATYTWY